MTDVTVAFLQVGQGDCTLAIDPDASQGLMIDCPAGKSQVVLDELAALPVASLALAVATHSDLDHLGGIYTVVTKFPTHLVRLNMAPVVPADADERKRLKAALRALASLPYRGIDVDDARTGESGSVGRVAWRVLRPDQGQLLHAQGVGDPNNASVVIRLDVDGTRFLISGDADPPAWQQLISEGTDLQAAVFLFPHHGAALDGSKGADAGAVLDAVAADIVVLSFGPENKYGHPEQSTLAAISARSQPFVATADWAFGVAPLRIGTIRFRAAQGSAALA